jgi:hypothetical protein
MKRQLHFRLVLLFTLLVACHYATAQSVKPDYTKNYKFGALKRFKWQENELRTARNPEDNKSLDRKIMRTVTMALADKGIVEDASNPDFYLFYHAGIGDQLSQVGSSPTAGGIMGPQTANSQSTATWGSVSGSSAGFAPSVWYSLQGEVVFYVVDAKSKLVVWQCRATKKWNDVPKARKNEDQEIRQIVDKSFKYFPPKG